MKYYKIDKEKWGTGYEGGYLLVNDPWFDYKGKMCCLGFLCQQVGYKKSVLADKVMPSNIGPSYDYDPKRTKHGRAGLTEPMAKRLAVINDSKIPYTPVVRLKRINDYLRKVKAPFRFKFKKAK